MCFEPEKKNSRNTGKIREFHERKKVRNLAKYLFTRNVFQPVSVITTVIKCVLFIVIRIAEKMCPSAILSIIHTVTIGIMLNFNGGNNGHKLKNVTWKQI